MIFISDRERFNINLKYERYGENYREIIQKKWDMRKLNRKISKNLGIKNKTEKRNKI